MTPLKEVVKRYEICKTCPDGRGAGHICMHHKGCCFGRWRTKAENDCPLNKWPRIEQTENEE